MHGNHVASVLRKEWWHEARRHPARRAVLGAVPTRGAGVPEACTTTAVVP